MLRRFLPLIAIILFSFLTGCSTISYYGHSTERHYSQAINLPSDYPTKAIPDGNIWDAIGRDLKFSDNTDLPHVREQIRWFQQHQDFLNRTIERGAPYIYYIYQETKRRHLPAELVLIPIFESSYNPNSRAYTSAVGLWQFMPRTAKGYGLKMNRWYDGRCDIVASTNEALKYFTYLYSFFDKDWFLAISAYDAGEGRIQRAILNNQRRGLSTNFWDLDVKQETIVYVPKLLALSAIIRAPERYGVKILSVNNGPYFEQVAITSQIDLKRVAKLAETDIEIIKRLNPAFKRGVTDPDGPHVLLIPKSKVAIFKANLEGLSYTPPETSSTAAQVAPSSKWHQYTVKRGENLSQIARKSHTTAEVLRKINGFKNNKIKPGQKILITTRLEMNSDNDDETVEKSVPTATVTSPIKSKSRSSNVKTAATIPYKTANGDNIYRIAKHFHTTPEKIKTINHLPSNAIKIGQVLQIPIATPATTTQVKMATPVVKTAAKKTVPKKTSTKVKSKTAQPKKNTRQPTKTKKTRKRAS